MQTLFPINAVLCFAFHMWLLFSIATRDDDDDYYYYYNYYYCYYYYRQEK